MSSYLDIKNKKSILIVCRGFYPEQSPRAYRSTELACEFARKGHHVRVLTIYNSEQIAHSANYGYELKNLGRLTWPSVKVHGKGLSLWIRRVLSRLLMLLFEYPMIQLVPLVKKALSDEDGYDLLISVAVPYPIHWGVACARSRRHRIAGIWIADCGDPYYFNYLDSFRKPFYFRYVERWFSKKADFISIPREEMKPTFLKEIHEKIIIIPQGLRFENFTTDSNGAKNQVPTFAYAGSFIRQARDPRQLLEVLTKIDIDFRFLVYTKHTDLLIPYLKLLGDKLVIKDYIPRQELILTLSRMDFLVNIGYDPVTTIPSKLIDYALAKRPVLNITENDDPSIIKDFIEGDYSRALNLDNISIYNIESVTNLFLARVNQ